MSQRRSRRKRWIAFLVAVLLLVGGAAFLVWYKLFREVPTYFADDADHFKYGSIGNESYTGIPYWIWLVLPRVFPEHLPGDGGYASFGMVFEPGQWKGDRWVGGEVPIGLSKKTVGFPLVAMNCAFCHATSVREEGQASPTIIPSGPSHQFDPQAYIRFLGKCRTTAGSRPTSCSTRSVTTSIWARSTHSSIVISLSHKLKRVCWSRKSSMPGWPPSPTGGGAGSIPSIQ